MGWKPQETEWELSVARDLAPHLLPAAQSPAAYLASDVSWLPDGGYGDILESAGPIAPDGMLVVPAAAWLIGWLPWRRRCLYSPRCVLAVGERGVAVWVQALPAPGVRVRMPVSDIASVEQHGSGPRRLLVVTGRAARLSLHYGAAGQAAVDAWTRPLRTRVAQVRP